MMIITNMLLMNMFMTMFIVHDNDHCTHHDNVHLVEVVHALGVQGVKATLQKDNIIIFYIRVERAYFEIIIIIITALYDQSSMMKYEMFSLVRGKI